MPVTAPDIVLTVAGESIVIDVLANDSGEGLVIESYTAPQNGALVLEADQTFTYTPNPGFAGVDGFTYTVRDAAGEVATGTVSISVLAPNRDPVAGADVVQTAVDQTVLIPVLANDQDPDGDPLTLTAISMPSHGTVTLVDAGTLRYIPQQGFTGTDRFTYTVSDGRGGVATGTVTVQVLAANRMPSAPDLELAVPAGVPTTIDLLAAAQDPDGDPLRLVELGLPGSGRVAFGDEGQVVYTPNPGFEGADSFTYLLADGRGGYASGTVRLAVVRGNLLPTAPDLDLSTPQDTPLTFDLLAQASDPDGDPLRLVALSAPASGRLEQNADGTLTYIPDPGFHGQDGFTYTVSDGRGDPVSGQVQITVALASGWTNQRVLFFPPRTPTFTLDGFTALVDLTAPELRTVDQGGQVARSDGGDIRFEDLAGVKLPHHLRSYDGVLGRVVADVRLPGWNTASGLALVMRYGNPQAQPQQETAAAFAGMLAAWALPDAADLTGQGRDLVLSGVASATLFGRTAALFDGVQARAEIADATWLDGLAEISILLSLQNAQAGSDQRKIVARRGGSGDSFAVVAENPGYQSGAPAVFGCVLFLAGGGLAKVETEAGSNDAAPHALAFAWRSGDAPRAIVDGRVSQSWAGDALSNDASVSGTLAGSSEPLVIGDGGTAFAWSGVLGELFLLPRRLSDEELRLWTELRGRPEGVYALGADAPAGEALAPAAAPFYLETSADQPLAVPLLARAWSPSGQLAVVSVANAQNGTVTLDGAVATFTPASGFTGAAGFDYTVSDPVSGKTATARVSISVRASNPWPSAWPQPRSGNPFHLANAHASNDSLAAWEAWLGVSMDIRTSLGGGAPKSSWEDIAGGPGNDPTLIGGQLDKPGPGNELWKPASWPVGRPVCDAVYLVPYVARNRREGGVWTNPGIWQEIAAGAYDSVYRLLARRHGNRAAMIGKDAKLVVIEFEPEFTGTWRYGSVGPDTANFIQAWRRIVDIFRQEYEAIFGPGNVPYFLWRPSPALRFGQNATNYNGPERLWNAYPGNDWVDFIGISIHDKTGIATAGDWELYLRYPSLGNLGYPKAEGFYDFFDWAKGNTPCWFCCPEFGINTSDTPPNFPLTQNPAAVFDGMNALIQRYADRWAFLAYLSASYHALHWTAQQQQMGQRFKELWGAP